MPRPRPAGRRADLRRELFFDHALLPSGWARDVRITVADGTIVAVAQGAPRAGADHVPGIAVPGLPNLHSHAFQRGMAGLAERRGPTADSFWTWREVMYHFLQRLSPDDVEAIAAFAYMEMLEAGFTTVGEFHYLHHDVDGRPYANLGEMAERIAAASAQTRIGLTLLPSFYAYGGFGGAPPVAGQRRFINDPDRFLDLVQRARATVATLPEGRVGIAPHSLRAVTPGDAKGDLPGDARGADPYPRRRAAAGSGGMRRRPRPSPGGMAARECRARFALVRDPRDPHDTGGDSGVGGLAGGGRSLPADRSVARRRHL